MGHFHPFWAISGNFWGWFEPNYILGYTNIVEQVSFSMLPSILTFYFGLILVLFFTFWVLMGYIWGSGRVGKLFWDLLM